MRIGIFTETYAPYISGLVTSVLMLKNALEKKGHEVYIITANLETIHYEYDEKDKVLKIPGIPTGIYNARLTSVYPIRAVNMIKKWKLDVIHSQTEFAIGTFARVFAKQYNIPLVHTYHTMYEDYTHYITKGYFEKSSKKIVEYLTKFYCDKTATELIVPTAKAYALFKEKYEFTRNVHIVPTGIEVDRFHKENINKKEILDLRKQYGIRPRDFVLVFVGRIAEEKNVLFLINVIEKLKNKIPNLKLLIIGDGPDKDNYEKVSKDKGCGENIIFTDKVPWEKIPVFYQLGNLFITASKTETQGLTIIEAMGAGLPSLCIEDVAFRTMVFEGFNGKFFNTEEECQNIILELYKDKKQIEELSKQAIIQADHCSTSNMAESVLIVYDHAIRRQNRNKYGIFSVIARKIKGEN